MNDNYPDRPGWFKPREREYCSECGNEIKQEKWSPYCSRLCLEAVNNRKRKELGLHYASDRVPAPNEPLRRIQRCGWCRKEGLREFCSDEHERLYIESLPKMSKGKSYDEYLEESGLKINKVLTF